jgi:integrase
MVYPSLHALRHTAASLWIDQALLPKRIQMLCGHSSIRVTFDEADQTAMAEIEARLLRQSQHGCNTFLLSI